jgi:hypothetical protein
MLVEIRNTGFPTIAEHYRLKFVNRDGSLSRSARPVVIDKELFSKSDITGNLVVDLPANEILYNKTLTPIPTGGIACGWLAFDYPGVTMREVHAEDTEWTLSFSDIDGKSYEVITTHSAMREPGTGTPEKVTCGGNIFDNKALQEHNRLQGSPQ